VVPPNLARPHPKSLSHAVSFTRVPLETWCHIFHRARQTVYDAQRWVRRQVSCYGYKSCLPETINLSIESLRGRSTIPPVWNGTRFCGRAFFKAPQGMGSYLAFNHLNTFLASKCGPVFLSAPPCIQLSYGSNFRNIVKGPRWWACEPRGYSRHCMGICSPPPDPLMGPHNLIWAPASLVYRQHIRGGEWRTFKAS